jgi:hypothetical protein
MYQAAEKRKPSRWTDVEREFLQAMWEFDRKFASGEANQGDNQNGKGDLAGAPKTLRNPSQKNPRGRMGSADLDKRIKEAGLKTIDLKAEWARSAGKGGGPTNDLVTWLRRSKPLSFLFMAIRVVDENDRERTIHFANAAAQMMDAVGLVA